MVMTGSKRFKNLFHVRFNNPSGKVDNMSRIPRKYFTGKVFGILSAEIAGLLFTAS